MGERLRSATGGVTVDGGFARHDQHCPKGTSMSIDLTGAGWVKSSYSQTGGDASSGHRASSPPGRRPRPRLQEPRRPRPDLPRHRLLAFVAGVKAGEFGTVDRLSHLKPVTLTAGWRGLRRSKAAHRSAGSRTASSRIVRIFPDGRALAVPARGTDLHADVRAAHLRPTGAAGPGRIQRMVGVVGVFQVVRVVPQHHRRLGRQPAVAPGEQRLGERGEVPTGLGQVVLVARRGASL